MCTNMKMRKILLGSMYVIRLEYIIIDIIIDQNILYVRLGIIG